MNIAVVHLTQSCLTGFCQHKNVNKFIKLNDASLLYWKENMYRNQKKYVFNPDDQRKGSCEVCAGVRQIELTGNQQNAITRCPGAVSSRTHDRNEEYTHMNY